MRHPFVLLLLLAACAAREEGNTDDTPQGCTDGATECRADGLYTCSNKAFTLTQACTGCTANACPDPCANGVKTTCAGDSIKDCATGKLSSCQTGTCLQVADEIVCATKPGETLCSGRASDGTPYGLVCANEHGVATDQVCDLRSGHCVAASFDCSKLSRLGATDVACDGKNFLTACTTGQPRALVCGDGTKCSNDGSFNCYTSSTAGGNCGGPAVCYPGLHCTQTAQNASTCVRPAGQIACSASDDLAVCNDNDTAVVCTGGTVWWWKNLSHWGGSCANNVPVIPAGGNCIPGLADCKAGLACARSAFDVAGVCRTPAPGAPAECTLTQAISSGHLCNYQWKSCLDGKQYGVACTAQNVAGHVLTTCDCLVNGQKGNNFASSEICGIQKVEDLDRIADEKCGWHVTTVATAPGM